ncbi:MAG: TolC family protein [Turicibacter sp.]|nr:TolC family protein [Turicibacter sp.]
MMKKVLGFALLLSLAFGVMVQAAEEAAEIDEIQYVTALRGALRDLPALLAIEDSINSLTEARDNLQGILILRRQAGTHLLDGGLGELEAQIADLSANINNMRAIQTITRLGTEFSLRNSIVTINNALLDIYLLERTIEQYQRDLSTANLRLNAGLISDSDLRSTELALQQRESSLVSLRISLETEYQNLNRILQRNATTPIQVVVEKELIELPTNLDEFVRQTLRTQPNIRQQEITFDRARSAVSAVHPMDPQRTSLERARNQAERELLDTRRATELAMRNQHNTLEILLINHESLEIDLARALERVETVEANQRAGFATLLDIEAARLAVLSAEIAIERNFNNLWNLQFTLKNPFLLTR